MTIAEEVRNAAYYLLETKGEFSIEDIRELLKERKVEFDEEKSVVRVSVSQLVKKDNNIIRYQRGKYRCTDQYIAKKEIYESKEMEDWKMTLDKMENEVKRMINKIKTFDWIDCEDEEVKYMRNMARQLKQFKKNITEEIQQI